MSAPRSVSQVTLDTYNTHVDAYAKAAASELNPSLAFWLRYCVKDLPFDSAILEVGSGLGADADFIESLGFKVVRTDGAASFVEYQRNLGKHVELLDLRTDELGGPWDLVLADAVLLHFPPDQAFDLAVKVRQSLAEGGRFALSLKTGQGSGFSMEKLGAPRFFAYWSAPDAISMLFKAGFVRVEQVGASLTGPWIHLVATA